jgi:sugar/nucleoside kinase (ribokinase family)
VLPTLDYLAVGHATADVHADGRVVLGGAVSYAARAAAALGQRAGVVTRAAAGFPPELPAGVAWNSVDSPATTTFSNRYDSQGRREQMLHALAPAMAAADVPADWRRVGILHLAPIDHEIGPDIAAAVAAGFVGLTPQGWLRALAVGSAVVATTWQAPAGMLVGVDAVVLSDEDVGAAPGCIEWLAEQVPVLAVTRGPAGVRAYAGGRVIDQPAFPARVVDPTGAGDTFAAAFFIRLHETGDVAGALAFAAAAAALAIEAVGVTGLADRAAVEARMAGQLR